MIEQQLTPQIRQWILKQSVAGFDQQQLLESMRSSGWNYQSAVRIIAQVLEETKSAKPLVVVRNAVAEKPSGAVVETAPEPGPDLADSPLELDLGDCTVRVLMTLAKPRVALFEAFLDDEECDQLIELASERLVRSKTVDRDAGGLVVNPARSSTGMFFARGENPLCERIEKRIERLLRWPVDHAEGLQVLRYTQGAEYRPHYDYFDPHQPDIDAILARGGQRIGTLVMYLNSTPRGGATIFPEVGLEIAPVKGNAVWFGYTRAHPESRTLHGGTAVLQGEKWVATKWLRERSFT